MLSNTLPDAAPPEAAPPCARETLPAERGDLTVHSGLLQDLLERSMADYAACLDLSRRCPPEGRRPLSAIAAEERRCAKRLAAALFLLTGVLCRLPQPPPPQPREPWPAGLRSCYFSQQQKAADCLSAAETAPDGELSRLYTELAHTALRHARLCRELLELL